MALRNLALACAAAAVASAQSDTQCGNATQPIVPGKHNVLLVGDSISMSPPYTPGGYGTALAQLLEAAGVAVQHAGGSYGGGQCSNTVKGMLCTNLATPNNYLNIPGGGSFSLVHFNYGLHDLVAACVPGGPGGECEEHVPLSPPTYGANLVALYERFATIAPMVMWTTTTPVPNVTTSMGRTYELAIQYNEQALMFLSSHTPSGLLVNDLWSDMIAHCGVGYTSCDLQLPANVHLTPAGIAFTAQSAFKAITAALAGAPVPA